MHIVLKVEKMNCYNNNEANIKKKYQPGSKITTDKLKRGSAFDRLFVLNRMLERFETLGRPLFPVPSR